MNDRSCEQAVLGSALMDERAARLAVNSLRPEDFAQAANGCILDAMGKVLAQGLAVDLVSVMHQLQADGNIDAVGGMPYLVECSQATPTSANIETYISIITESSSKRRLLRSLQEIVTDAAKLRSEEILSALQRILREDTVPASGDKDALPQLLMEEFYAMERRQDRKELPLCTGLPELDSITGGLSRGELWVLGARPSVGKSALAMQIAETVVGDGGRALFFSAEMSRAMVAQRYFAGQGIPTRRTRSGNMHEEDWNGIVEALKDSQRYKRLLVDTRSTSLPRLVSRIYREKLHDGLDACLVDYLQIISGASRYENRNLEVAAVSAGLKAAAKDNELPVVLLSQLSRSLEMRTGKERAPKLADLRDSGGIEQDADVVLLMSETPEEEARENLGPALEWTKEAGRKLVTVEIAKNRNGPLGRVHLAFDGERFRFCPAIQIMEEAPHEA